MTIYEPMYAIKDPKGVLDYTFDWASETNGTNLNGESDWLASGETIVSEVTTVTTGLTKDSDAITDSNTSVTVWLSGGTVGADYEVECKIVTSALRTDARTLIVQVRER